jgi:hypothetical protein
MSETLIFYRLGLTLHVIEIDKMINFFVVHENHDKNCNFFPSGWKYQLDYVCSCMNIHAL